MAVGSESLEMAACATSSVGITASYVFYMPLPRGEQLFLLNPIRCSSVGDPSGLERIPQVHRRIGWQPGDELCTARGDTLAIPGWRGILGIRRPYDV